MWQPLSLIPRFKSSAASCVVLLMLAAVSQLLSGFESQTPWLQRVRRATLPVIIDWHLFQCDNCSGHHIRRQFGLELVIYHQGSTSLRYNFSPPKMIVCRSVTCPGCNSLLTDGVFKTVLALEETRFLAKLLCRSSLGD